MSWLLQLEMTCRCHEPCSKCAVVVALVYHAHHAISQVLGDEVDGWFNVQSADGRRGLVPSTYIEIRN